MNSETQYIEFIGTLHDTVYRLARSIVGEEAEAEDITQDIFERVWRARDAVLQSDYPRAYICRMARNLAIDRQRAKQRAQSISLTEQSATPLDDTSSELNRRDMAALSLKLIERLPERQRLTMHMRDVEGYEIEEIALILESDEASVRVNLSRARRSVREQLLKIMNYGVREN